MNALFLSSALLLVSADPKTPTPLDGVVELADENLAPLIKAITQNQNVEDLKVEMTDVFTGTQSIRQKNAERHTAPLPGWNYKIVEKPKANDEFRYIRFAWRKDGGGSILIAFAVEKGSWTGKRYAAGPYNMGGSGFKVGEVAPLDWTVVTRDLFKDFGAFTLTGVLFSSTGMGTSYYDHILLGRSVEELDKATDFALGKNKPTEPLTDKRRDELWVDMMGGDQVKAGVAYRTFLAVASTQVEFIQQKLPKPRNDGDRMSKAKKLVDQLRSQEFDERQEASDELPKLGNLVVPLLRAEADRDDRPESRYRAREVLKVMGVGLSGGILVVDPKAARITRLLERANTVESRKLLERLASGEYGDEYTQEAQSAQSRLVIKK